MAITKNIQNGSEFLFNAWNGKKGYTLDLDLEKLLGDWVGTDPFFGQTSESTLDAAVIAASEYDADGVLLDVELTGFDEAFGADLDNVEWSFSAYDNVGFSRTIVSVDSNTKAVAGSNDDAKNLANTLDNMANSVEAFAQTDDADTHYLTSSENGAAYAGQFGPTYQDTTFNTSNTLSDSADLYLITQTDTSPVNGANDGAIKQLANAEGKTLKATTYQQDGVWRFKVELADNEPTPEPEAPGINKDIQNGSELIFSAWDGENGYTLDLDLNKLLGDLIGTDPFFGQTGQSTLDAAVVSANALNNGILFDGKLTGFAEAFGKATDNIEWSLSGYDNVGFSRTLVTADNAVTPTAGTNAQAKNLANTLDNMANSVEAFAATDDADTYHVTSSNNGAAYAGQFGPTYQGNVFDTTNELGDTADMFVVTQNSSSPVDGAKAGLVKQLTTEDGRALIATTYQKYGDWYLKVEVAPEPEAQGINKDIQNGSELIFNAWDGEKGYTLDLDLNKLLGDLIGADPFFGQTGESTLAAAVLNADQLNDGVLFDGKLTGFAQAFGTQTDNVEWSLSGYDNVGFNRTLITADNALTPAAGTNAQAQNLANTLDNMANSVEAFAATDDADTYHVTSAENGAAYAGQFGPTYQGNVFDTSNTLGETAGLFVVTQSSSSPVDAAKEGLVKQLTTEDGTNLVATTYQKNGEWYLKVELEREAEEVGIQTDVQNGSEFLFNAWNGETGYTLDLDFNKLLGDLVGTDPFFGQTVDSTLDAAVIAESEYNKDGIVFDGELTGLTTAFGEEVANIEWSLTAFDTVGFSRAIVSADKEATPQAVSNGQTQNLANTLDNMANSVSAFAATNDADTYYITSSANGAAYAGQFGPTYQGNVFDTSNTLGDSANLFLVTESDASPLQAAEDGAIKQLANEDGMALVATTYEQDGAWRLKLELLDTGLTLFA